MRVVTTLISLIISAQLTMAFTERELEIILNGDSNTSFRILLTTDPIDSFILKMQSYELSRDQDFTSIIFQHELDHLNGILFTDKICVQEVDETVIE
ncbi:MAG TPA: peptide deformylase [Fermentimonas sp.]|nr:peptide deformylase [Fermentimonas sp.]